MSGSMEPAIPIGSIVIIKDASAQDVRVNDVLAFKTEGTNVIHRVIEITNEDSTLYFKTKGDANEDPDPGLVGEDQIMGKLLLVIPFYGYLINFARTPFGFLSLVMIPAILFIIIEVWRITHRGKVAK